MKKILLITLLSIVCINTFGAASAENQDTQAAEERCSRIATQVRVFGAVYHGAKAISLAVAVRYFLQTLADSTESSSAELILLGIALTGCAWESLVSTYAAYEYASHNTIGANMVAAAMFPDLTPQEKIRAFIKAREEKERAAKENIK